ncbi:MAG: DUF5069 domain-containing protein [Candidatus Velthaea sp.]
MSEPLPFPGCDLREHPPRGPSERLGGLVFLPRTIDKMRAKIQGTLGAYKIAPGMSGYLLEWLGISEEAFEAAVRGAATDDEIAHWVRAHSDPAAYEGINERLSTRAIRDAAHLAEVVPRYPLLADHPHLRNWFEILEQDDAASFRSA